MSNEIDIRLTKCEAFIIRRHLDHILQINQRVADLRRDLVEECDELEMTWQNVYRRNLLEKIKQGKEISEEELHIPPSIKNGELRIMIIEEHNVRVVKNG